MIRSIYFKRSEFACKCGCGFDAVDVELLTCLEFIRLKFNAALIINCGCRCFTHNIRVKKKSLKKAIARLLLFFKTGKKRPPSQHELAKAVDFKIKGVHADKVADFLEEKYPGKYGIGRYKGRTHFDVRSSCARWDNR